MAEVLSSNLSGPISLSLGLFLRAELQRLPSFFPSHESPGYPGAWEPGRIHWMSKNADAFRRRTAVLLLLHPQKMKHSPLPGSDEPVRQKND
jgi:hypothetical protein